MSGDPLGLTPQQRAESDRNAAAEVEELFWRKLLAVQDRVLADWERRELYGDRSGWPAGITNPVVAVLAVPIIRPPDDSPSIRVVST